MLAANASGSVQPSESRGRQGEDAQIPMTRSPLLMWPPGSTKLPSDRRPYPIRRPQLLESNRQIASQSSGTEKNPLLHGPPCMIKRWSPHLLGRACRFLGSWCGLADRGQAHARALARGRRGFQPTSKVPPRLRFAFDQFGLGIRDNPAAWVSRASTPAGERIHHDSASSPSADSVDP